MVADVARLTDNWSSDLELRFFPKPRDFQIRSAVFLLPLLTHASPDETASAPSSSAKMMSSHLASPPTPSSLRSLDAYPLLCTKTPSRLLQRRRRRRSNLSRSVMRRTDLERTGWSTLTVRARDGGAASGEVETAVVERPRPSSFQVSRGRPMPLGATARDGGVNFSVYSSNAASATLCLISLADLNEVTWVSFWILYT
ncbi:hypothetical protein BT93_C1266 [Corymbia citriodora subsp. variegata]|nr:hypothetical protein BT93_C1266 [Corymbia citriodora subsp. variegata]